jgi:hypothetical protein
LRAAYLASEIAGATAFAFLPLIESLSILVNDRSGFTTRDWPFVPLNDGDQTHFGFPIEGEQNWVFTIREEMRNALDVATFRIVIRFANWPKP